MNEAPRKLYVLTYRAMDGSVKHSWFASKVEALKAASRLTVDFEIAEGVI